MKTRGIWVRFPCTDRADAICRTTLSQLAVSLGMSEVEMIQYALRQLAKEVSPVYEPDDGDLAAQQIAAIRERVPQGRMKSIKSRLF